MVRITWCLQKKLEMLAQLTHDPLMYLSVLQQRVSGDHAERTELRRAHEGPANGQTEGETRDKYGAQKCVTRRESIYGCSVFLLII